MKISSVFLLLTFLLLSFAANSKQVWVIPVQGAIGPASSDYISREISLASEQNVALIVLKMDTPGGLDSSMRDIIREITTSSIPIATWVGPSGARAASAGTYILLASHIAAMANATNLGAATPVAIGMQGSQPSPEDVPQAVDNANSASDSSDVDTDTDIAAENKKVSANTTLEKKAINDATAYIKGLAKLHGRNEEWAAKAVTEAASLDAQEALTKNVIDFIADDIDQLVSLSNGREIKLAGTNLLFILEEPDIVERIPDWRFQFLATITNPNIAYILMLVGIYGLLLEFYNPGIGLPGVLGGICLLLAMYALQMLPVNYVGLALILLGIGLFIIEAFNPSFGILGLGGIVSFVLGSVFLMDSDLPAYQIAKPLIYLLSLFLAFFTFIMVFMLLKIRKKQVTTGVNCLLGKLATVTENFESGKGWVEVEGESWQATSKHALTIGQKVVVEQVQGLSLTVTEYDKTE
ncbi:MAG: nodulation protein NfeD [Psychromonas sp.]